MREMAHPRMVQVTLTPEERERFRQEWQAMWHKAVDAIPVFNFGAENRIFSISYRTDPSLPPGEMRMGNTRTINLQHEDLFCGFDLANLTHTSVIYKHRAVGRSEVDALRFSDMNACKAAVIKEFEPQYRAPRTYAEAVPLRFRREVQGGKRK
jgi:hypothetical protein